MYHNDFFPSCGAQLYESHPDYNFIGGEIPQGFPSYFIYRIPPILKHTLCHLFLNTLLADRIFSFYLNNPFLILQNVFLFSTESLRHVPYRFFSTNGAQIHEGLPNWNSVGGHILEGLPFNFYLQNPFRMDHTDAASYETIINKNNFDFTFFSNTQITYPPPFPFSNTPFVICFWTLLWGTVYCHCSFRQFLLIFIESIIIFYRIPSSCTIPILRCQWYANSWRPTKSELCRRRLLLKVDRQQSRRISRNCGKRPKKWLVNGYL